MYIDWDAELCLSLKILVLIGNSSSIQKSTIDFFLTQRLNIVFEEGAFFVSKFVRNAK